MNIVDMWEHASLIAIHGLIVLYLAFGWTWDLPPDSLLKRACDRLLARPLVWIGLYHSWEMFSPNPMRSNDQLLADVRLDDGTIIRWRSPRFDRLGRIQAFLRVRDIKLYEHLTSPRFPFLKPAFAAYLTEVLCDQGLCPIEVVLKCQREPIPDPITGHDSPRVTHTISRHRISPPVPRLQKVT